MPIDAEVRLRNHVRRLRWIDDSGLRESFWNYRSICLRPKFDPARLPSRTVHDVRYDNNNKILRRVPVDTA